MKENEEKVNKLLINLHVGVAVFSPEGNIHAMQSTVSRTRRSKKSDLHRKFSRRIISYETAHRISSDSVYGGDRFTVL